MFETTRFEEFMALRHARGEMSRRSALAVLGLGCATLLTSRAVADADPVSRRQLGRTGLEVSVVGFGGLSIGLASTEQNRVTVLLNQALDNGLNFIDTAECYGLPDRNHSESLIGQAISARRQDYYLCSKVGHENGVFGQEHEDWSQRSILRTIDRSLERLRTDYLDVVYLHGCSVETIRNGAATDALQLAREQGKVRYLGYSGGGERVLTAIETDAFDVVQISLNVFDQQAIDTILPRTHAKDIGVVIKRPLGNAVWRFNELPDWWYYQDYWRLMHELEYPFLTGDALDDPGPNGAGGVALRFVASIPGVHSAIVGTQRPGRWSQNNANLTAGPLDDDMYADIRKRWRAVAG